jgi:hypothetical protein
MKDGVIYEDGYRKGREMFRKILQMDDKDDASFGSLRNEGHEISEHEVTLEFNAIDSGGKGADKEHQLNGQVTWNTACEWWGSLLDGDDIPWTPDPGSDDTMNRGLVFDLASLQDVVMHCHYITRTMREPLPKPNHSKPPSIVT